MKPRLSPSQGQLLRAVVLYLSKGRGKRAGSADIVVESIESVPWASLTFDGTRHRLAIRLSLPAGLAVVGDDLAVPGCIVAIERADWAIAATAAVLTLDLLTITIAPPSRSSPA